MSSQRHRHFRRLLRTCRATAGMTQFQLGEKLGLSARTIIRYERGQSVPVAFQIHKLVSLVRPEDEDLAEELLDAARTIVLPWAESAPAPSTAMPVAPIAMPVAPVVEPQVPKTTIDSVLLAAADAADVAPRTVKKAVVAAFARARELGLTLEAVDKGLRGGEG